MTANNDKRYLAVHHQTLADLAGGAVSAKALRLRSVVTDATEPALTDLQIGGSTYGADRFGVRYLILRIA